MLGYVVSVKVLTAGCHRAASVPERSQDCPVTMDTAQATVEPTDPMWFWESLSRKGWKTMQQLGEKREKNM